MSFLARGKTNWKYILVVVVLAVIVGGGILGYIKISEIFKYWTCNKLEKLKSVEFNKLDFSCETDADCTIAPGEWGPICVNINTNTEKYKEIFYTMIKKDCLPLRDFPPVECKCVNNKCERIIVLVGEITISSPTKGEKWVKGETYQIRWAPTDPTKTVGIILRDARISDVSPSKVWQAENIPDTGIYSFTVPYLPSGDKYQIYIGSQEKSGYSELFSIVSPAVPDEIIDWKTYRDDWGIVEFLYSQPMNFDAFVIVFVPPDNFETWLSNHPRPATGPSYQPLLSSEDLILGELSGKKRIFDLRLGSGESEIVFKHTEVTLTDGRKLLVIDFDWHFGSVEKEQKIIDKIISTVKFFPIKPINTTTWKIYENKEYQFQFRYPLDYIVEEKKTEDGKSYIVITSPKTEEIIKGSLGEVTDQIFITPRETAAVLYNIVGLPQPIQPTEEYFSSKEVSERLNTYLGKITINGRLGFQLLHSEMANVKYALLKNPDDTWFVIESALFSWIPYSKAHIIEPYDSILATLKFTQ